MINKVEFSDGGFGSVAHEENEKIRITNNPEQSQFWIFMEYLPPHIIGRFPGLCYDFYQHYYNAIWLPVSEMQDNRQIPRPRDFYSVIIGESLGHKIFWVQQDNGQFLTLP